MNNFDRRVRRQKIERPSRPHVDERIVYGAHCTWWDEIYQATTSADSPHGLPSCPGCGSPLYEVPNERIWWDGVDKHEQAGAPGYHQFIEWLRGKCFPDLAAAQVAFEAGRR